jgi:hypothetical protein
MYGNTHSLAVSRLKRGLIAAGTDDGLVQVSRNDGKSWQRSESFPGVPDMIKVAMLTWSATQEGTLFVVFDGHKDNDFRPYVVRSDDYGVSWTNISSDLPAFGSTRSIAVHPRNGNLIFVGTDFGIYASRDGGSHWFALGSGLPTNSVQGIVVHPRENDLVIGTHGRGFWVLDELSLLENMTPAIVSGHSYLAPPRPATQIRDRNRGRNSFGHGYWTAENPPRGTILDYWIGDSAIGQPVSLEVFDGKGRLVHRSEESAAERGAHRLVWDLRHPAPPSDSESSWRKPLGRFVLPGDYEIRLSVGDQTHRQTLNVRPDPALELRARDLREREDVMALQTQLLSAAYYAGKSVDTALELAQHLLAAAPAGSDLHAAAQAAADELQRLHIALRGEELGTAQQETRLPLEELTLRLYMTTESWSGAPSPAQRELTRSAHRDLSATLAELRPMLSDALSALKTQATEAGLAWPAQDLPAALSDDLLPQYRK